MRTRTGKALRGIGGGLLMAELLYLALAIPGLLSDRDSTVPLASRAAQR